MNNFLYGFNLISLIIYIGFICYVMGRSHKLSMVFKAVCFLHITFNMARLIEVMNLGDPSTVLYCQIGKLVEFWSLGFVLCLYLHISLTYLIILPKYRKYMKLRTPILIGFALGFFILNLVGVLTTKGFIMGETYCFCLYTDDVITAFRVLMLVHYIIYVMSYYYMRKHKWNDPYSAAIYRMTFFLVLINFFTNSWNIFEAILMFIRPDLLYLMPPIITAFEYVTCTEILVLHHYCQKLLNLRTNNATSNLKGNKDSKTNPQSNSVTANNLQAPSPGTSGELAPISAGVNTIEPKSDAEVDVKV